jgi:hypothetical protein
VFHGQNRSRRSDRDPAADTLARSPREKLRAIAALPTAVLVNLEMTDKLRIVILLSIPVGAYNFGTVRDSLLLGNSIRVNSGVKGSENHDVPQNENVHATSCLPENIVCIGACSRESVSFAGRPCPTDETVKD